MEDYRRSVVFNRRFLHTMIRRRYRCIVHGCICISESPTVEKTEKINMSTAVSLWLEVVLWNTTKIMIGWLTAHECDWVVSSPMRIVLLLKAFLEILCTFKSYLNNETGRSFRRGWKIVRKCGSVCSVLSWLFIFVDFLACVSNLYSIVVVWVRGQKYM